MTSSWFFLSTLSYFRFTLIFHTCYNGLFDDAFGYQRINFMCSYLFIIYLLHLILMEVKTLVWRINPLNAELNAICHLMALLGAHHIFHVSRITVNAVKMNEISQIVHFALWVSLLNTKPKCHNFTIISQLLTKLTIFIKHRIRDVIGLCLSQG